MLWRSPPRVGGAEGARARSWRALLQLAAEYGGSGQGRAYPALQASAVQALQGAARHCAGAEAAARRARPSGKPHA